MEKARTVTAVCVMIAVLVGGGFAMRAFELGVNGRVSSLPIILPIFIGAMLFTQIFIQLKKTATSKAKKNR